MILYTVTLPKPVTYIKVRDVARKIDPLCIITVIKPNKIYEFQSKAGAEKVAKTFNGTIELSKYTI